MEPLPDVDELSIQGLLDFEDPYSEPYSADEAYLRETGEGKEPAPQKTRRIKSQADMERHFTDRQDRTFSQKVDFLVPTIVQMIDSEKMLHLSPKYQRRFRWNRKKQSLLIESILLNVPLPAIFVYESEFAKYEVMDGRQRLTTLYDYIKGAYKLQGLTELDFLNGKSYDMLPPIIQASLRRASLPVTIILTESSSTDATGIILRQRVFERLNTGGQILNPQEVRNCIYYGHLNDMLVEISRSKIFTESWGVPAKENDERLNPSDKLRKNRLFSTMQDCAIVLRYFAFEDVGAYSSPKSSLDKYMRKHKDISKNLANELRDDYLVSLGLARDIYGEHLFRIYPHLINPKHKNKKGLLSVPYSDAILSACKRSRASSEILVENRALIISSTLDIMKDRVSYDTLIGSKNTREELKLRLSLIQDIFDGVI